ncbi:MAG: choice-of-anchor B family protein, partial [Woeseiaceae bacterium]|nr:choice-of-anchor B family protein [Woeseiaceae bacterium]
ITNVRAGFDPADRFETPGVSTTVLLGVPAEYRSQLASLGFHVVADRKFESATRIAATEKYLAQHRRLQSGLAATPCVGGSVNGLECDNTELLAHVPFGDVSAGPGAAADVWGFVDLNTNREYAIVGYNIGTAVFDVTDAQNPREVGFVDGQNTTWRDIKVYQFWNTADSRWNAYAYVTTDGVGDGLFVIDMTELPQRIRRIGYGGDFSAAHNVYAIDTDFGTGLSLSGNAPSLVIAGSNNGGGRFRLYSLASPQAPAFVVIPSAGNAGYMHDAASLVIGDSRKDTQCVNATDACVVLFDFNETTVDIWDISNTASPQLLSRTQYANAAYTHSGWPSEDGQYLFVHDEVDEQNFGLRTTLRTFSLADLRNPVLVGTWTGPTAAIDHNGFVRGNRYYMSNYSRGLTILDITDATSAQPVGFLDTYPFSNNASFVGAWGAYPYFHSGNIAVSDMSSGFYMIGDETLDSPNGTLSFAAPAFAAPEGGALTLTLSRSGGSSGSVSVTVGLLPATADATDVVAPSLTASWADGDVADKTVVLSPAADGIAEGLERLLVKLTAPTGGATLGTAVASAWISDVGDASVVEFDRDTVDVAERGFGTAVVTLRRSGSALGAVSVDYALANGDAIAGTDYSGATSGTISWPDGDADPKSVEFDIIDDGSGEDDEFFELALSAPVGATLGAMTTVRVNVLDGTGINQSPVAVAGASRSVSPGSVVTLNGSASTDPDGDALAYQWTQTLGTTVTLTGADTANASFTAPAVSSDTLLQFRLQVTDPGGLSDASTTNVTVLATTSNVSGGGGGAAGSLLGLLLLVALLRRRYSNG